MNINDYLLDVTGVDWPAVLAPWRFLVPAKMTVWLVNRFGDIFAVLDDDSIHMLDVGAGTFERVASSRDDFCSLLDTGDNADQWLMIPLVHRLVAAGMHLRSGCCYGYLRPPVLGGAHTVENTVVIPVSEHYGLNAAIHSQIKDLPDGTRVKLTITDD